MDKHEDPYEILGVDREADESTIKKAYFKLARQFHPDKQETEEEKQKVHSKFAKISDAYNLLNDPARLSDWKQAEAKRQAQQAHGGQGGQAQQAARSKSPGNHGGLRRRSKSPGKHHVRRPSAGNHSVRSPASLSPRRNGSAAKSTAVPHGSIPPHHGSHPRTPPRRTAHRSVSPVPPKGNTPIHRLSPQGPHDQSRDRTGRSPSAHRNRNGRRPVSPLPPRGGQSPGKKYAGQSSPGTLRRKSASLPQPPSVRRASSGGKATPPPSPPAVTRASFGPASAQALNSFRRSWSSANDGSSSSSSSNSPLENAASIPEEAKRDDTRNPFDILKLRWTASKVEVLSAYREMAQQYHHTSKNKNFSQEKRQEAANHLANVTWAYETLRDPKQLHEWQRTCKKKSKESSASNNQHKSFHDSISSLGSSKGWFPIRKPHGNSSKGDHANDEDDDDDARHADDDGEDDDHEVEKSIKSNSTRRGERSAKRANRNKDQTKISLLATLGFPAGQSSKGNTQKQEEEEEEEEEDEGEGKKTCGRRNEEDESESVHTEDVDVTGDIPPTDPLQKEEEAKPMEKKKKKKNNNNKKKKVLTDADENANDDGDGQSKKTKKKKKKKDETPTEAADHCAWQREESKLVLEDSIRTASETREGSRSSLEEEHPILLAY